ncbi:MAG: hypothetical protein ACREJK_01145, partial [Candidatus Methylomirabilales bacterium]
PPSARVRLAHSSGIDSAILSAFPRRSGREESLLFRKLAENFELCVYGLGHIRAELTRLRNRTLQRIWGTLLS